MVSKFKFQVFSFLLFFLILNAFSSFLTVFRTREKSFQYADVSIQNIKQSESFLEQFSEKYSQTLILNFGKTQTNEDVTRHILDRLFPTVELAFFSVTLGGGIGIFLGVFTFYLNSQLLLKVLRFLSFGILSTPIFVIAVLLFLIFFLYVPILPPGGYDWKNPAYLVLPSLALGSRVFARIYIFTTAEIKKEELSFFVKFLFARGISREKIYLKYILLKSFPLLFTFLLLDLSSILSGAMIVEEIFFYPGIGKSMFYAIKSMDANLLNGLLIYTGTTFYIFINLAKRIQTLISDVET